MFVYTLETKRSLHEKTEEGDKMTLIRVSSLIRALYPAGLAAPNAPSFAWSLNFKIATALNSIS